MVVHLMASLKVILKAWGLEIKCPLTKTHLKWLDKGKLPPEHKAQVQGLYVSHWV